MPPRVAQTGTDAGTASLDPTQSLDTRALNATLAAYNDAQNGVTAAQQKLDQMPMRPADDANGHDTGGKGWDKTYQAAAAELADAKAQAATASRQYATVLQQQSAQAAKDNTPAGQAKAAQVQAQADYVQAKADGYAATTAAAQQAAATRAQAALTRANATATRAETITTANGIYTKDDPANPGPDGSPGWRLAKDAQGVPLPGTRDPAQQALTQAQADAIQGKTPAEIQNLVTSGALTQAQADAVKNKTPAEIAQLTASANASNASAINAQANAAATTAKTPAEIAQLQASTAATTSSAAATAAKTPAEIAQLQASAAAGDANAKKTLQDIALASLPKYGEATPTSGSFQTITDPTTGQQTTRPNPNAPIVDVNAAVQQLQQQAQAKRDDLQKQVLNGVIDQNAALQQFNDFWNGTVEPQKQALAAAQRTQQQQDFTNQVASRTSQNQSDQNTESAANSLATHQQNAATLGSGLLQKRAELANQSAQNVLGIATGSKNFGIAGGAVPDVSNLFNAATDQATQQLGGQGTMDAAQRMVQSIDPTNKSGFADHAYAALSQVLDRAQGQQPLQAPGMPDTTSMLDKTQYSGAFAAPPPPSPTTTIAPDGTVTISHSAAPPAPTQPLQPFQAIPNYGPARSRLDAVPQMSY